MTITITAFERSPDGDWRVIRAFAGRLKKSAIPRGSPCFVSCDEGTRAALRPSARFRPTRKAISPCSRQARSCSISPSAPARHSDPGRIGQFMVTVRLTRWELVRPKRETRPVGRASFLSWVRIVARAIRSLVRDTRLSSLDQRCDFVVLRIDDDHLVVLDEEGMGLELRHLG